MVKCYSMVKLPRAEPGDTRNIIMWTEGQRKNLREEGDENNEQFSNTEIQRGDVVSRY